MSHADLKGRGPRSHCSPFCCSSSSFILCTLQFLSELGYLVPSSHFQVPFAYLLKGPDIRLVDRPFRISRRDIPSLTEYIQPLPPFSVRYSTVSWIYPPVDTPSGYPRAWEELLHFPTVPIPDFPKSTELIEGRITCVQYRCIVLYCTRHTVLYSTVLNTGGSDYSTYCTDRRTDSTVRFPCLTVPNLRPIRFAPPSAVSRVRH